MATADILVDEYDTFSNSCLAPYNTVWEGSDMLKSLTGVIETIFITIYRSLTALLNRHWQWI
jgi:hypothetical protein